VDEDDCWPVLRRDDLTLRVLRPDDASGWRAGDDEEQRRWFEFPGPAPLENVIGAIAAWRDGWRNGGPVFQWGLWVEDKLVGGVELRIREDDKANASYVVFPAGRRRRVATRALNLACEWALDNLPISAVVAVIHPDNVASQGVALGAGFSLEGWAERWEYGETGPMLRYVLPLTRTTAG
jgi:RimJ/RimL family protein N-acetyltransferase